MDNQASRTQEATGKVQPLPALLNLDAALTVFREEVEPLITVTEATDWDGPKLLAREGAILKAGLTLVGQCIALLLFNLVSSPEVQRTARERTQHLRQPGSTGHGNRRVNITLIGGVVVPLGVEYVVARKPRHRSGRKGECSKRGRAQDRGFYPVLELLGIAERLSPLVRSLVAEHGTLAISFEAAHDTLAQMGIVMRTKRVARITHAFHQVGLQQRRLRVEQVQQGTLPTSMVLAGQRVVIAVDGGRTRLRRPKRGRRRKGSRHHGYHAEWKEPKLLTIYVVDERGRKIKTERIPVTNDGTFEGVEAFMALPEMHLVRLGIRYARSVLIIGDGASWIWLHIPALLRRLGCPAEITFEAIDFCHAAGQLNTFAQLAFPSPASAQAWFKRQRRWLKQGRADTVLNNMRAQLVQAKETSHEEMQTLYEYFVTHRSRMAYHQLAKHHLPIGSGVVESLIRQVVNLRLKGNGKFWLKEHAEGMLLARCWWAAGQWNQFRNLVLTDELTPALSN